MRTHARGKGRASNVLAASDDGGGAARADGVPLEGAHAAEAKDAVEHADRDHDDRDKEAKEVRHAEAEHADQNVDDALHKAVVEERKLGRDGRHVQLAQNHRDAKHTEKKKGKRRQSHKKREHDGW